MDRPLVSVLMPVYQGQNYIESAINSILKQSFSDFELIIVDNNSSDSTGLIVKSFNDSRIRYVRNEENIGPANNWNLCLNLSTGKYIKLTCHDDLLDYDCLRKQVEILEKDKGLYFSFVFSSRKIIDENDNTIFIKRYPFRSSGPIDSRKLKKECIRYGTNLIGEPGTVLFRSSIFKQIGEFSLDNLYVIDLDYWFRLLNYGDGFYLNEELFSFRIIKKSLGDSFGFDQANSFIRFVKKYKTHSPGVLTNLDCIMGFFSSYLNMIARRCIYLIK